LAESRSNALGVLLKGMQCQPNQKYQSNPTSSRAESNSSYQSKAGEIRCAEEGMDDKFKNLLEPSVILTSVLFQLTSTAK
jgi:hypothetical protein